MLRALLRVRVLGVLAIVAAVVAVAVWPRAVDVDVTTVSVGPMVVTIDESGRTRVRDRFVVTAPVAGEVGRIALEPGDRVVKGRTVLATIRAAAPIPLDARSVAEATAGVQSAEAAVGRARAERDRAVTARDRLARDLKRLQSLASAGAVSRETLESTESELKAAEDAIRASQFVVAQAEHEREVARARLAHAEGGTTRRDWTLLAPVDGIVLARHQQSQVVVPAGAPLAEIGDPARLEIVSDLLSTDAVKITPGSEVIIDEWGGDEALSGRVRRVEPSGFTKISALGVEEQRVNVIMDFELPEGRMLGDGYRVQVRVVIWRRDDVLKVPAGSLFRAGDAWAVFAIADGRARRQVVTVGHRSAREAEITDGLKAGDVVVLFPPDTLADGDRVAPRADNGGR